MVSVFDVINAVSDNKSLLLFNTIALSNLETRHSDILITRLHITKKQYYSRMSELVRTNLVTRRGGKYFPTSLGKIVYEAQTTIETALSNNWKLKAVDGLENSDSDQMPKEEYNEIIDLLIDNDRIKEQLIIETHSNANKDSLDSPSTVLPYFQQSIASRR
jgi:predicted transcriptional regulator